jgi:hypothetical protein
MACDVIKYLATVTTSVKQVTQTLLYCSMVFSDTFQEEFEVWFCPSPTHSLDSFRVVIAFENNSTSLQHKPVAEERSLTKPSLL